VAVDPDPVVGAVEALFIPLPARGEFRREARLLELDEADSSLVLNQLIARRKLARGGLEYAMIVSNIGTNS